jgi:hypothetical protein
MQLFSSISIVTTGSGIGQCLSFLCDPKRPANRVIWQTKDPLWTYGQPILDRVHMINPCAEILESGKGRVNMLPPVMRLYKEFGAEAVCVISNPVVTRKLVFECESRGVPAFGPIFDCEFGKIFCHCTICLCHLAARGNPPCLRKESTPQASCLNRTSRI